MKGRAHYLLLVLPRLSLLLQLPSTTTTNDCKSTKERVQVPQASKTTRHSLRPTTILGPPLETRLPLGRRARPTISRRRGPRRCRWRSLSSRRLSTFSQVRRHELCRSGAVGWRITARRLSIWAPAGRDRPSWGSIRGGFFAADSLSSCAGSPRRSTVSGTFVTRWLRR